MIATIEINSETYTIDLTKPIDISIALKPKDFINAWGLDNPRIYPITDSNWVASVSKGAAVNCNNITFNPHGHTTHTECVGHIIPEFFSINKALNQYLFLAELITIPPKSIDTDFVISKKQLQFALSTKKCEAVIIRTLPNTNDKLHANYSSTNPPYLSKDAAIYLKEKGVNHLLIDLPSVDKEQDEGKLLAHNAFWNTGGTIRYNATITELIFVPNTLTDGLYILQLNVAAFENDAVPSKPVVYKIEN